MALDQIEGTLSRDEPLHLGTLDAFYGALLGLWASMTLHSRDIPPESFLAILGTVLLAVFCLGVGRSTGNWQERLLLYFIALLIAVTYRYWFGSEVQPALNSADKLSEIQLWFIPITVLVWAVTLEGETRIRGH